MSGPNGICPCGGWLRKSEWKIITAAEKLKWEIVSENDVQISKIACCACGRCEYTAKELVPS